MKINVLDRPVEHKKVKWEGVERDRWEQWAILDVDGLPTSFMVGHNEEKDALPPGEYELDPKSFSVTNGRLQVNRVVLKPVKVQVKTASGSKPAGQG